MATPLTNPSRDPSDSPGPHAIHRLDDEECGLRAFVVLDDLTLGPALGGVRFKTYEKSEDAESDAVALARQMTWKCSFAELDAGGGKAVVDVGSLKDRTRACEVLGDFVESLGGIFQTAGDLGATRRDLEVMSKRTRFVVDADVLPALGEASALGLISAFEALAPRLGFSSLEGLKVIVQGLGDIGMSLARHLHGRGACLLVADLDPVRVKRACEELSAKAVAVDGVWSTPADILSPCAVGGQIDEARARDLPVRAIIGGANRILSTDSIDDLLWERGVLYAPDFVVNAGAVIYGGLEALRGVPAREDEIMQIGQRVERLFDEAFSQKISPARLARTQAEQRLIRKRGS